MSEIALKNKSLYNTREERKKKTRRNAVLISEDREIINALEELNQKLNILYNQFNYMTDPALIDSCIYDIKAAHSKYSFYLNRCKEKQIKAV